MVPCLIQQFDLNYNLYCCNTTYIIRSKIIAYFNEDELTVFAITLTQIIIIIIITLQKRTKKVQSALVIRSTGKSKHKTHNQNYNSKKSFMYQEKKTCSKTELKKSFRTILSFTICSISARSADVAPSRDFSVKLDT